MEMSIVEMARRTADNMGQLVIKLAERVEELEAENSELKRKLEANADDLK